MTENQTGPALQDFYPEETQYCYGCGPKNEQGLHIRSFWDGDETVAHFEPRPYHIAVPGYVYGGLVASLIDCHGTGSAAAYAHREEGRELGSEPPLRFVTGSLHVDYLKPTPLGVTLTLRGRKKSVRGRVVTVSISLYAEGVECARGEVTAVRIPDAWLESLKAGRSGT